MIYQLKDWLIQNSQPFLDNSIVIVCLLTLTLVLINSIIQSNYRIEEKRKLFNSLREPYRRKL